MKLKKKNNFICETNQVEKKDILIAIQKGATTVAEIIEQTGACGQACREKIQLLLNQHSKDVFNRQGKYKT